MNIADISCQGHSLERVHVTRATRRDPLHCAMMSFEATRVGLSVFVGYFGSNSAVEPSSSSSSNSIWRSYPPECLVHSSLTTADLPLESLGWLRE